MNKLNVPYINQRDMSNNEDYKICCGLSCIFMVLDYLKLNPDAKDIYSFMDKKAFTEHGLSHSAINTYLGRIKNVLSYSQVFPKNNKEAEIKKIKENLINGNPVIASIFRGDNSTHLIVITGFDEENFFINDSDYLLDNGKDISIKSDDFIKKLRGLYIFIEGVA